MSQRLEQRTRELKERGACGIAPYITAGDGGLERTGELLFALERAGAACVELGVPFSDPIADGPILQAAARRALDAGTNLHGILECVRSYRAAGGDLPIALFSYANPLIGAGPGASTGTLAARWDQTCERLEAAGVDALLVPDVPVEEGEEMRVAAAGHGLCPIFFVSPTTSRERLARAAQASRGFLYAIGRTGTTGAETEFSASTLAFLQRVREASSLPIGVGFGLRNASQVRAVSAHAELAIVGSALVQHVHEAAQADPTSATEAAVRAAERFVLGLQDGTPA